MKKLLMAAAAVALTAVTAVSMVACSTGEPVKIVEVDLTDEEYAFILPKGSELEDEINGYIAQLKSEEGLNGVTINELFEAEANGTAENIGNVLTELPAGVNESNRDDYFVVATNAEFEPFEYYQGQYFAGIDMHIAQLFAQALDRTLVIRHMEFDAVIPSVSGTSYSDSDDPDAKPVQPDSTQADIGMAGLTVTERRAKAVTFSDSYYNAAQRVAVLEKDAALFDGCTTRAEVVEVMKTLTGEIAGAATGQTGYTYLAGDPTMGPDFAGYADVFSEIKQYSSIGQAVQDLTLGRLKVVVGDKFTLAAAVNGVNG